MKIAPFKVVKDKSGNRGIYKGAALIEFQPFDKEDKETDKQLDNRCAWYNTIWDDGFTNGVEESNLKKLKEK